MSDEMQNQDDIAWVKRNLRNLPVEVDRLEIIRTAHRRFSESHDKNAQEKEHAVNSIILALRAVEKDGGDTDEFFLQLIKSQ